MGEENWQKYYKFTIICNPWERMVSIWGILVDHLKIKNPELVAIIRILIVGCGNILVLISLEACSI